MLSPRDAKASRALRFQQPPGLPKSGAGEGNRTPVVSLEGFCSTIELHPLEAPAMPFGDRSRQPPEVDLGQLSDLGSESNEAPERYRCSQDRTPLVARLDLCGAMARLID